MPEEEDAMFVGRKEELARLEKMYAGEKMEMVVVYGRRRVGKTTLISEFCKNKRTVFFSCLQMSAAQNLEALSAAVARAERRQPLRRGPSPAFSRRRRAKKEEK